jgi:hypothetical protein
MCGPFPGAAGNPFDQKSIATMLATQAQADKPRRSLAPDATSCGSTQCTRERTSGEPKRVSRGGGALSGELDRAKASRRRPKSASTFGRHSRPDAAGVDQLAIVVIVAEQKRAEMRPRAFRVVQPTTTNSWRLRHFDLRHGFPVACGGERAAEGHRHSNAIGLVREVGIDCCPTASGR